MTSKNKENKSEEIFLVFDDSKVFELDEKVCKGEITEKEYLKRLRKI